MGKGGSEAVGAGEAVAKGRLSPAQPKSALNAEAVGLQIFGNVGVDQPDLAVLGIRVGLRDRGLAVANRLDLGAGQRNAGLNRVLDRIVESGLSVFGDNLDRALVLIGHIKPS